MFKDITLGQYYPGNSVIHNLDPRTKILGVIFYIVLIFLIKKLWVFALPLAFILGTVKLSKLPISYVLKSLKPLRFILLFMFVINMLVIKTGEILVSFWIITITTGGIRQAVFIALRLLFLVAGTSLLTLTTTPISLTDGLESLLSPLKKLRFPAHELAMMMTIALRFIPTLLEEADKIMKAQLSRGADFESGNILKRAKAMVPILVPLFVSAFRRADELAMAMESRCYHGGEGRTRLRVLKLARRDYVSCFVMLLILVLVIFLEAL